MGDLALLSHPSQDHTVLRKRKIENGKLIVLRAWIDSRQPESKKKHTPFQCALEILLDSPRTGLRCFSALLLKRLSLLFDLEAVLRGGPLAEVILICWLDHSKVFLKKLLGEPWNRTSRSEFHQPVIENIKHIVAVTKLRFLLNLKVLNNLNEMMKRETWNVPVARGPSLQTFW